MAGAVSYTSNDNFVHLRPCLWTDSGVQLIDTTALGDGAFAWISGISADGRTVVGNVAGAGAFLWTAERGARRLADALRDDYNFVLPEWAYGVSSISADGLAIGGEGHHVDGSYPEGWVVIIPAPATSLFIPTALVALARRRR